MKELNINGVVYAKYEIDSKYPGTLFLKVVNPLLSRTDLNENYIIDLISVLEKTRFKSVGYLNVD